MKKHLLLTGLLAVLTFNSAKAQGYYYQNDGYYEEAPLYQRQVVYQQPQYREVQYVQVETPRYQGQMQPNYRDDGYVRQERPRYRRVTNADARRYEERKIYKSEEPMINKIRPYIGLDIATSKAKFGDIKSTNTEDDTLKSEYGKSFKDNFNSISGVIGIKMNKYFGIEAYYQQSSEEDKKKHYSEGSNYNETLKTTIDYRSYGADLIGYLPVFQEFEILAALGLGQYDFSTKGKYSEVSIADNSMTTEDYRETTNIKKDFNSLGVRLGIGAQYNITEHVALRGTLRYVKMVDDDYIKNLVEASLGIRYMF